MHVDPHPGVGEQGEVLRDPVPRLELESPPVGPGRHRDVAPCQLAGDRMQLYSQRVSEMRDLLSARILQEIPHSRLNGSPSERLPNNAHFTFFGVNGEDLIIKLDEYGIAASTGSACSVKKQKPSHVLKAMGFSYEEITGSLHLSIGAQNTEHEIDKAVAALSTAIGELRQLSPFKGKYAA